MEIRILYEDEYILALDKPSGLMVHLDGRSKEATLVDWINEHYPALIDVGEPETLQNGEVIKRPGIVHRLDRDTSGVILVAKTQATHQFLKEQFQNHKVEKVYHCFVWGIFADNKREGVIDKPIGRSASDFRKWSAEYGAKGEMRGAVTEYRVLGSIPPYLKGGGNTAENSSFSYLEVRPRTGRTHQIRVHLKSISHPVVCDKLYGNKVCDGSPSCLSFNRLALHALSIRLELPDQSFIQIESPLPEEFERALQALK